MGPNEQNENYVYQPEPAHKGKKIYGVAGPNTEMYENKRFTKEQAQAIVDLLNFRRALQQ